MTTMEKWIGYKEEGSLIPRGRGTPDMMEGHDVRDNETPTLNMAIQVLAYIGKLIRSKYNLNGTYVLMKTHGYVRLVGALCNGRGAILTWAHEVKSSISSNS